MKKHQKIAVLCCLLTVVVSGSEKPLKETGTFLTENVNKSNYPALLSRPKGEIVDAITWTDSSGKNIIVISSYKKGALLEKGYASELYAYQFQIKGTAYDTVWKIKDFNNTDSEVEYATGTLKLIDIDRDGIAESSFFYTISSSDRQVTKSMLHTKGKKLAIRGYYTVFDSGDDPRQDSLVVDPAFKKVNKIFREFAEKEWSEVTK